MGLIATPWCPYDEYLAAKAMSGPSAMVPWFLMASYLYYQRDLSLMTDDQFDGLCRELLMRWDHVEHQHKGLIDVEMLRAGSGFNLTVYPMIVVGAAERLMVKAERSGSAARRK